MQIKTLEKPSNSLWGTLLIFFRDSSLGDFRVTDQNAYSEYTVVLGPFRDNHQSIAHINKYKQSHTHTHYLTMDSSYTQIHTNDDDMMIGIGNSE